MSVNITAADVNKLRQMTGAGMMDCRKALAESNGDFEKAIDYLRAKGQKVAANRSDRSANEGVVIAKASSDNKHGVVVQISSETDFVAKNQEFIDFAQNVVNIALTNLPENVDALKSLPLEGATVGDKLMEMVAKIGEKIDIAAYEVVKADSVIPYIHGNYRIGVLVGLNKSDADSLQDLGKDVAMQIAAMNPLALDEKGVSQETIDREKAIAIEQIVAEGKPAEMAEKIAAGKMNKFFKDNTLLSQPFVKDNSLSIKDYLVQTDKELTVTEFKRVAIG